jgi:hypothetical protein
MSATGKADETLAQYERRMKQNPTVSAVFSDPIKPSPLSDDIERHNKTRQRSLPLTVWTWSQLSDEIVNGGDEACEALHEIDRRVQQLHIAHECGRWFYHTT